MPYTFDVVAWEGWDQSRHGGTPATPQQAKGMKVLVTNPNDSGDTHQFWAFARSPKSAFQTDAEWFVYIGSLMEMYGMGLEDEGPPGDDDEPPWDDEDDEEEEEDEPPRPTVIQRIGAALGRLFRRR